jgi:hypothetical protein
MRDRHSRKVRFVKATLERTEEGCRASVELSGEGDARFRGGADGRASDEALLRTGALAAAAAVAEASGIRGASVEVKDIAVLRQFGTEIVLVSIVGKVRDQTKQLYGVCSVQGDLAAAAALAVLNATNRVFDLA